MAEVQSSRRSLGRGLVLLGGAVLAGVGLWAAGGQYADFRIAVGGTVSVPPTELAFYCLYAAYGTAFVALLARALAQLRVSAALATLAAGIGRHRAWPLLAAGAVTAQAYLLRMAVLRGQVVTDDEDVYLFNARTLLGGHLVNPLPEDPAYFVNQFVLLNTQGWFGKYPPGHSAVLAAGQALHVLDLLLPLMGAATCWFSWCVARRWLSPRRAALAAFLLAVSPQFTFTHATLLSQVTSTFFLMAAAALVSRRVVTPAAALGVGALLAAGVLTRPMPGVLLVPVVLAQLAVEARARRWLLVGLAGAVSLLGGLGIAAVNHLQSGSSVVSAYQAAHGELGLWGSVRGQVSLSLMAGLLRQNFWLFGWPASLLPVFFARPRRGGVFLWGVVGAALVYRVVVPKTVVAVTGPIYLMEAVPALALLAADGLGRAWRLALRAVGARRQRGQLAGVVSAAVLAGGALFVPVQLQVLDTAAAAREVAASELEALGVKRALVFANLFVDPKAMSTWAYFPPNPSPSLDDDVVYVRMPPSTTPEDWRAFWARRFPDRPAFTFEPRATPALKPLLEGTGSGSP